MSAAAAVRSANASGAEWRRRLRAALPALSLALVIAAIAWLNPRAISYFGFTLMLNLAIPIALATIAQMFVIAGNDLDLSIGTFVGFVGCVTATWLRDDAAGSASLALDRLRSRSMPRSARSSICATCLRSSSRSA